MEKNNPKKTLSHTYRRDDIFKSELDYINERRKLNGLDPLSDTKGSWGICFSGGGIRSATFCLGILQKFTRENIFKFFDYLSTVSGGGYIGSCLSSLLSKPLNARGAPSQQPDTGVEPGDSPFVGLNKDDDYEEKESTRLGVRNQIHHLRTHGEYLIPRSNLLSRDLQRAVGTIFAGVLHHIILFLLALIALTSLLHFILFSITEYPEKMPDEKSYLTEVHLLKELNYSEKSYYKITEGALSALESGGISEENIGLLKYSKDKVFFKGSKDFAQTLEDANFSEVEIEKIMKYAKDPDESPPTNLKNEIKTWLYTRVGIPLYLMFFKGIRSNLTIYAGFFIVGIVWTFFTLKRAKKIRNIIEEAAPDDVEPMGSGFNIEDHYESKFISQYNSFTFIIIVLAIFIIGIFNVNAKDSNDISLWVLFLPLAFSLGMFLPSLILINYRKSLKINENRILRSLYNCVMGASFYSLVLSLIIPIAIVFLFSLSYFDLEFWWSFISLLLSYLIFKGSGQGGKITTLLFKFKKPLSMLFLFIFMALAFELISDFLIQKIYPKWGITHEFSPLTTDWLPLLIFLSASIVMTALGFIVNSNKISPHYFYRDRLTEAYLKTDARIKRDKEHFKKYQGMPLVTVRDHEGLKLSEIGNENNRGPYHLIVAALNLQGSKELNRKTMLSEHFIFSRNYVGSKVTGYVKTGTYRNGNTKLARAMTISAAAAGSAMGQHSFGAQAFTTTLFNVRLGYWMANPWYYIKEDKNPEPKFPFWPKWLLLEMLGRITARDSMINLSDGGHTGDNLGLLPLLQRGCRAIVVCDAEADKDYKFESFNNAVRMAFIEENIRIDIDLSSIVPEKEEGGSYKLSGKSTAIGKIIYPDDKDESDHGLLIYIKSSLSKRKGPIPVHVKNYHKGNPDFPHQTTADQFFDDAQFEAYRALGEHIGEQAISRIRKEKIIP